MKFLSCMLSVLFLIGDANASNEYYSGKHKDLYAAVEKIIQTEYATFLREYGQKFDNNPNELTRRAGYHGVKFLYYNKGFIYFKCAVDEAHKGKGIEETGYQQCTDKRLRAFLRFTRMNDMYLKLPQMQQIQCLMQSRLVDDEIDFPAFPFLELDTWELYDFDLLNTCFTKPD